MIIIGHLTLYKAIEKFSLEEIGEVEDFVLFMKLRSCSESHKTLLWLSTMLDEKTVQKIIQAIDECRF